jgi:hypothetical protein
VTEIDGVEIATMKVVGIETITVDGTDDGTNDGTIMTNDGYDGTVSTTVDGTVDGIQVAGTMTGLLHWVGTITGENTVGSVGGT